MAVRPGWEGRRWRTTPRSGNSFVMQIHSHAWRPVQNKFKVRSRSHRSSLVCVAANRGDPMLLCSLQQALYARSHCVTTSYSSDLHLQKSASQRPRRDFVCRQLNSQRPVVLLRPGQTSSRCDTQDGDPRKERGGERKEGVPRAVPCPNNMGRRVSCHDASSHSTKRDPLARPPRKGQPLQNHHHLHHHHHRHHHYHYHTPDAAYLQAGPGTEEKG